MLHLTNCYLAVEDWNLPEACIQGILEHLDSVEESDLIRYWGPQVIQQKCWWWSFTAYEVAWPWWSWIDAPVLQCLHCRWQLMNFMVTSALGIFLVWKFPYFSSVIGQPKRMTPRVVASDLCKSSQVLLKIGGFSWSRFFTIKGWLQGWLYYTIHTTFFHTKNICSCFYIKQFMQFLFSNYSFTVFYCLKF
jgi:hypothetical protein